MKLVTIRDAAAALGVSESKLRRAALAKEIPSMKLGNRTLVDLDAVRDIMQVTPGVSIKAVSEATGLNITAIRRGIHEGWMPCAKAGKAYTFQLDEVLAAIEQRIREQMSGGSR